MEGLVYLADTNVFLEALLGQDKKDDVQSFLQAIDLSTIFITDLSLHSIGIILYRLNNFEIFISFVEDIVIDGIRILSLNPEDLKGLGQTTEKFNLDFDDAYQYAVAAKYELQLVSFDTDFDQTERKRKKPAEVLT